MAQFKVTIFNQRDITQASCQRASTGKAFAVAARASVLNLTKHGWNTLAQELFDQAWRSMWRKPNCPRVDVQAPEGLCVEIRRMGIGR